MSLRKVSHRVIYSVYGEKVGIGQCKVNKILRAYGLKPRNVKAQTLNLN